jgi:hypothetical protein
MKSMKRIATLVLMAFLALSAFAGKTISEKEKQEIMVLLDKQVEAWNEGNLEKFMETYWNSEKLVFVGSRGPTYGWQATLANYKKGYPDKAAMGILNFKILDISKIDKSTVFLIGRFELTREIGDVAGHFTLLIQKINKEWKIVSDHSSAED